MDKSPLQSSRRPYSPCYKAPEWISHRAFFPSFVRVVSDSIEYILIYSQLWRAYRSRSRESSHRYRVCYVSTFSPIFDICSHPIRAGCEGKKKKWEKRHSSFREPARNAIDQRLIPLLEYSCYRLTRRFRGSLVNDCGVIPVRFSPSYVREKKNKFFLV